MEEFFDEDDGFYDLDDPKEAIANINKSTCAITAGCVVEFAPDSFFAVRGGRLRAKVIGVNDDDDEWGTIDVKCLDGTDCYLSPGETESFPLRGWEKTLRILEMAPEKKNEGES